MRRAEPELSLGTEVLTGGGGGGEAPSAGIDVIDSDGVTAATTPAAQASRHSGVDCFVQGNNRTERPAGDRGGRRRPAARAQTGLFSGDDRFYYCGVSGPPHTVAGGGVAAAACVTVRTVLCCVLIEAQG